MKKRNCLKIILCVALSVSLCLFSSCKRKTDEHIAPDEQGYLWAKQVIECFKNKDSEALAQLFCTNAQNEFDLENEIQVLFDFVDGEIVSYDEPSGNAGGGEIAPEGIVQKGVGGRIENIVTDKGTVYRISFKGYVIFEEDKGSIGICNLGIRNEALFDYYKGRNPDFYINDTPEVKLVEKSISYL